MSPLLTLRRNVPALIRLHQVGPAPNWHDAELSHFVPWGAHSSLAPHESTSEQVDPFALSDSFWIYRRYINKSIYLSMSPHPKWHHNWLCHFSTAHGRDHQTDRHTDTSHYNTSVIAIGHILRYAYRCGLIIQTFCRSIFGKQVCCKSVQNDIHNLMH